MTLVSPRNVPLLRRLEYSTVCTTVKSGSVYKHIPSLFLPSPHRSHITPLYNYQQFLMLSQVVNHFYTPKDVFLCLALTLCKDIFQKVMIFLSCETYQFCDLKQIISFSDTSTFVFMTGKYRIYCIWNLLLAFFRFQRVGFPHGILKHILTWLLLFSHPLSYPSSLSHALRTL